MTTRDRLLELLADGAVHSGEALAATLGMSRAAVWKQLQRLGDWGVDVEAVPGRGYRLQAPFRLLDRDEVLDAVPDGLRHLLADIEVHRLIDSTNRYLMEADRDPADRPARACLAEHQTAGRGRRGRQWQSPFGANIYLSLRWQFADTPVDLSALALMVGVVIAEELERIGVASPGLKWPNDLVWQGRKLGGILIELHGEAGGACDVVIGTGLNISMPRTTADAIDQPWVDLEEILGDRRPSRSRLAGKLTGGLIEAIGQFQREGFAPFASRWQRLDLLAGKPVRLEQQGQLIDGVAAGVDADGALRLEVDGSVRRFLAGDVSLRAR